jgi:hypothetical protein
MMHFLVYSDHWDVEGLISSPWGDGRASHIEEVIDIYAQDYPNLSTHGDYPTPEYLKSVTKQGATDKTGNPGWDEPTEGSEWIATVCKRDDSRPVWLTIWGAPDDLAQALHDHPEITSKLRVYWIGGPNRDLNDAPARYISENHHDLWIIEADETYRGFFNGGDTSDGYGNGDWPEENVAGHGHLAEYYMKIAGGEIKMGDTPAVLYTLDNIHRTPDDPTDGPGWGGQFVRQLESDKVDCPSDFDRTHPGTYPCCGGERPNCFRDNMDSSVQVGDHSGAETVAMHRKAWLDDWGRMMDRAQAPAK